MKSNPILNILLGVSLLASVVFCIRYVMQTRALRQLEGEVIQMNGHGGKMQMLSNITMEYARTNTSLDPILESVGLRPKEHRANSKPK